MSDKLFSKYFFQYCARTISHITSPRLFEKTNFELPKDSVLHYIPQLPLGDVPSMDWYALREYRKGSRRPFIHHIFEMDTEYGKTILKSGVNVDAYKRWFRENNRRFLPFAKIEDALNKPQQPLVVNYGFLPARYRYHPNPYNRMYRYRNLLTTVVKQIVHLQQIRKKNHFIFVDLPDQLPSRQHYMKSLEEATVTLDTDVPKTFSEIFEPWGTEFAEMLRKTALNREMMLSVLPNAEYEPALLEDKISLENYCISSGYLDSSTISNEEWNKQVLNWFPDDASMFLSELWKLISPEHKEGILYKLDPKNFPNVTLVFQTGSSYTCFNLGWLWDNIRVSGADQGMGVSESYLKILGYLESLKAANTIVDKNYVLQTIPETIDEEPVVLRENVVEETETETQSENDSDDDTSEADDDENSELQSTLSKSQSLSHGKTGLLGSVHSLRDLKNEMVARADAERQERMNELAARNAIQKNDEGDDANLEEPPIELEMPVAKVVEPEPELPVVLTSEHPLERGIESESLKLMRAGLISRAEHQRNVKLAGSFKRLPALEGEGTLSEYMVLPEDVVWDYKPRKLANIDDLPDQTMLETTLKDYDTVYAEKVMLRDTANMLMSMQKSKVAVTGINCERSVTAMDDMYQFTVNMAPILGRPSTWSFPIPKVNRNGKYRVNGVTYFSRKQKTDKPIRKIKRNVVQLSTYFGKLSVERSPKANYNYGQWVEDGITSDIVGANPTFTNVQYKDCFNPELVLPRTYTGIMSKYMAFDVGEYKFWWDYENWNKFFTEAQWRSCPAEHVLVGFRNKSPISMDIRGNLYIAEKPIGNFDQFLSKDELRKKPVEMVTVKVRGEKIPVGIILGYWFGLLELTKLLEVEPLRRKSGTRKPDLDYENFEIRFQDEVWTFPVKDDVATLTLMSLNDYRNYIKHYTVEQLSDGSGYGSLANDAGLSSRHIVELELIKNLFIDPIAEGQLKEMNEPVEIEKLMLRAVEMLILDNHPREGDTSQMVVKGYERMNGAVYRAMVKGLREFHNSPYTSKASVEINPFEVIADIQTDSAKSIVEDSNVIHNVKEKTIMTMSGTGARSKLALVKRTREFDVSDIGIRSEATVDSGDVGIIQYLTNNPNITSLRGNVTGLDPNVAPPSRLLSTTALLAPFATFDDPKRDNFISIQQSHVIEVVGASPQVCRTGLEGSLAHMVDDIFSFAAKGNGRVTKLTDKFMVIEYDDKTIPKDVIQVGKRYGTVTGHTVPHTIEPMFKEGEKVKTGSIVIRNKGFLSKDIWNRDQTVMNWGPLAAVTFMENTWTFEDSTRIRTEFSKKLHSPTTDTRVILARFEDDIVNLVAEGNEVDMDTPLCYITKGTLTGDESDFSQATLDNLRNMGADVPRAGQSGHIGEINVYFFGDKEDMSPSIRKLVNKYEKRQRDYHAVAGEDFPKSNEIIQPVRIKGSTVEINMIAIVVQIDRMLSIGDGDKIVVGNQMKSVLSGHIEGICHTENEIIPGQGIVHTDIQFSYRSMSARIVPSVPLIGLHTTLMKATSVATADVYFNG